MNKLKKTTTSYSNTNIACVDIIFNGSPSAKAGEVFSSLKGKHPRAFLGLTISRQHCVCVGAT